MDRWIGYRRTFARLALLGGLSGCAAPELPMPVCGRPEVLERVGAILQERGRNVVLDAPPVGELSALPGSNLVRCAVRAHTFGFDTNRFGTVPLYEPFTVSYTIERRQNGLFVSVDRAAGG